MLRSMAVVLGLSLSACQAQTTDTPQTGHGTAGDTVWKLVSIDGAPFPANATLKFNADGSVSGRAPCNSFGGGGTATYPDFDARRVWSTKRACPELRAENRYFEALRKMRRAAISGDTLTLTGASGAMVFKASD